MTLVGAGTAVVTALAVACAGPVASMPAETSTATASPTSVALALDATPTQAPAANQIPEATPLPSPTTEATNSAPGNAVALAKTDLRAGPDSSYNLEKTLSPEEALTVLGKTPAGDWYMVRTTGGSDGWAKADSLKLSVASSSVPVAQVPPVPPAAGTTPTSATKSATSTPSASAKQQVKVTGIGDSIMLGASADLQKAIGAMDIDAAVGRQVTTAIDILHSRQNTAQLAPIVVVAIGTNGPVSAKQFDDMMRSLSSAKRVVFVNLKVPRDWEAPNNAILADGVKRYPNTILVDWHAASAGHPELFWDDGIHPRPEGARLFADLIAKAVNAP